MHTFIRTRTGLVQIQKQVCDLDMWPQTGPWNGRAYVNPVEVLSWYEYVHTCLCEQTGGVNDWFYFRWWILLSMKQIVFVFFWMTWRLTRIVFKELWIYIESLMVGLNCNNGSRIIKSFLKKLVQNMKEGEEGEYNSI